MPNCANLCAKNAVKYFFVDDFGVKTLFLSVPLHRFYQIT